jgi:hypothetical protein
VPVGAVQVDEELAAAEAAAEPVPGGDREAPEGAA